MSSKINSHLNNFIINNIRPNKDEITALKSDIRRIHSIGTNNSKLKGRINRIFKGGSFGRKMMIKGRYEGDFVFLLNSAVVKQSYELIRDDFFKTLKSTFPKYKIEKKIHAITIHYKNRELDVLFAVEASSPDDVAKQVKNGQKIYYCANGLFQEKLYKKYLEKYPRLRERVQLAKFWLKKIKTKDRLAKGEIPKSYVLELLVYHHLDRYQKVTKSNATWFTEFLTFLGSNKIKKAIKFQKSSYTSKSSDCGINITDPGNPSENVAKYWKNCNKFQNLAQRDAKKDLTKIFN